MCVYVCMHICSTFKQIVSSIEQNINLNDKIITDRYPESGQDALICVLLCHNFFSCVTLFFLCQLSFQQGGDHNLFIIIIF